MLYPQYLGHGNDFVKIAHWNQRGVLVVKNSNTPVECIITGIVSMNDAILEKHGNFDPEREKCV